MDQAEQVSLLNELRALSAEKDFFVVDVVNTSPVDRYLNETRFADEMRVLFRGMPVIAAHSSELPDPGSYLTRQLSGLPVLLTRDKSGQAHAFINVCRHRGARLVADSQGCKNAFSCPYHGWTWDAQGQLRGVPHQAEGFPDLDRSQYGLKRLPVTERFDLVWVIADPNAQAEFDYCLAPLDAEFSWLDMRDMVIVHSDVTERDANWKLIVEGGIEAYHFRVTHKHTIGPHFKDNLSSYQMLGPHMRSVLPRVSIDALTEEEKASWSIRDHSNVLYSLMPADQFLVMQDHVAWIHAAPLSPGRTRMRISTLIPKQDHTEDKARHWATNHGITLTTLAEDFEVNEAVQAGLDSGANKVLNFGRFESALHHFHAAVEARLKAAPEL